MENWNKFVNEEEQVEEGIMDFFRSKDPADVALKEVEQYLETTSQNAFETAKSVLASNMKKNTTTGTNFDRRNIKSMKKRIQPIQINYSTGDNYGEEIKNLKISLLPGPRRGEEDLRLSYSFEFTFGVTKAGEDSFSVEFGVIAPTATDAAVFPPNLGSQVGDLIADKIGSGQPQTVTKKQLSPLLMSRARFIIDILPSLYRFVMADTYINYRGNLEQSAEDTFNDVLKPSYEEIQSKQVRV